MNFIAPLPRRLMSLVSITVNITSPPTHYYALIVCPGRLPDGPVAGLEFICSMVSSIAALRLEVASVGVFKPLKN